MPTRAEIRKQAQEAKKRAYQRYTSAVGTKYEHPVHGVGEIVSHRPTVERGVALEAPFIEVLLEFKTAEFWTAACNLGTLELVS